MGINSTVFWLHYKHVLFLMPKHQYALINEHSEHNMTIVNSKAIYTTFCRQPYLTRIYSTFLQKKNRTSFCFLHKKFLHRKTHLKFLLAETMRTVPQNIKYKFASKQNAAI